MIKQLFDCKGTASRREYMIYQILSSLPSAFIMAFMAYKLISGIEMGGDDVSSLIDLAGPLDWLQNLSTGISVLTQALCIPVTLRRLRELGWSGWWSSITLIPVIGWVLNILLVCLPAKEYSEDAEHKSALRTEKVQLVAAFLPPPEQP